MTTQLTFVGQYETSRGARRVYQSQLDALASGGETLSFNIPPGESGSVVECFLITAASAFTDVSLEIGHTAGFPLEQHDLSSPANVIVPTMPTLPVLPGIIDLFSIVSTDERPACYLSLVIR